MASGAAALVFLAATGAASAFVAPAGGRQWGPGGVTRCLGGRAAQPTVRARAAALPLGATKMADLTLYRCACTAPAAYRLPAATLAGADVCAANAMCCAA